MPGRALVTALAGAGNIGATIVLVGGRNGPAGDAAVPPHAGFVEIIAESLGQVGQPVMHAMWAPEISSGAPWACSSDPECGGVLPDVESTIVAATSAHAGVVTHGSKEEMERLLAPADKATLDRRAAHLNSVFDESGPADEMTLRRRRGVVCRGQGRAEPGRSG
jgi:hypothetical protein